MNHGSGLGFRAGGLGFNEIAATLEPRFGISGLDPAKIRQFGAPFWRRLL